MFESKTIRIVSDFWGKRVLSEGKQSWGMYTDYMDFNKSCSNDAYPLSSIDTLVDETSGYQILSFLNTYLGYTIRYQCTHLIRWKQFSSPSEITFVTRLCLSAWRTHKQLTRSWWIRSFITRLDNAWTYTLTTWWCVLNLFRIIWET